MRIKKKVISYGLAVATILSKISKKTPASKAGDELRPFS